MIRLLKISVVLLGLAMVIFSAWQVRAQEEIIEEVGEEITVGQIKSVLGESDSKPNILEQEVTYYLAYPGILPDHPIYWLKMLRDKLVETLTTETRKKIDLWVLYADKRIGAAKVLIEGNKQELGLETAQKAVGYLERAVLRIEELKKAGEDVGEVGNRLERGTLKYAQILDQLAKTTSGEVQARLEGLRDKALELREKILVVLGRE